MEPDLKRHLEVHLANPQVNYIQHENCKYRKLDRRLQFSKSLQFPRNYRRPQIITNYNLESSYFYHLSPYYLNSPNSFASNPNTFRPVNPVPPADTSRINYENHNINRNIGRNISRSLTRTISNPTNSNLPNILNRNQLPIFEFYNLQEYEPPDLSIHDLNQNSSVSIYLRGSNTPERCSICYEYIRSFEIVRKLSCGHQFHQKCVDKWFETKDNCPLCRYCLLDTDL